ncbi:hypothetical protein [Croceicoccus naphthovorans]|uniref:Uncharacterized protein n=1 Tax=Croceicoccus naphthovorans TaxID=1348774 RepID=A0A0G3XKM1_9SPHN|nr:hypothetical protein [Croceicoccus naphthovorans]AKM11156.1 hypothetical protein AB433_16155 [Croceicoccus naphthovorans]MBB3989961.1 hypothetical protein [Croceicoccus naphthovorans]
MKWLVGIFAALYLFALALLLIGTFGWFGQEKDPLSGVFLIPLGLPWNLLFDRAGWTGPTMAVLAPAINLAILFGIWRWRRAR